MKVPFVLVIIFTSALCSEKTELKNDEKPVKSPQIDDLVYKENLDFARRKVEKIENEDEKTESEAKLKRFVEEKENKRKIDDISIKAQQIFEEANILFDRPNKRTFAYKKYKEAADLGHGEANLKYAWGQLFGNYVDQDVLSAKNVFLKLASEGVAGAHTGLGFLYASGIMFKTSEAEALVHYMIGALGGNVWARMALGYRNRARMNIGGCEKPLNYYRLVAEEVVKNIKLSGGPLVSRIRLSEGLRDNNMRIWDKDATDYYHLLAEKGDLQSQLNLGLLYYQGGRGVHKDYEKSLYYYQRAAESGSSEAFGYLGRIYLEGNEFVKQSNETAFLYFKKSADSGNPIGHWGLGLMLLEGRGVNKDYIEAANYFEYAASKGMPDAQYQLGRLYLSGLGVPYDVRQAKKWFIIASQYGNVLSIFNLAYLVATGYQSIKSCSTALELFKDVAERGHWAEMFTDAYTLYRNGKYKEAFMHYAFLSELGYEVAQSNTAYMLEKGHLVFNDNLKRAKKQWGRSAEQGYSKARIKLGDYYFYGLSSDVDYELAAMHYTMASDRGPNAQALFNLGYMHENGLGFKKDVHLAKRMYDLAAEASDEAFIPVNLALLKIYILSLLKNYESLSSIFFEFWDLYLVTTLLVVLGFTLYFRRPANL